MTKRLILLVVPLFCVSMLASCRTPSAGITIESYPKTEITVNSKMVGNRLEVIEYNARKVNNLLQVQISAKNITRKDFQFEARFQWMDKDGMTVETPMTTWTPVSISAREKAFLKGIAPAENVEDFVFIVRFTRPSTRW